MKRKTNDSSIDRMIESKLEEIENLDDSDPEVERQKVETLKEMVEVKNKMKGGKWDVICRILEVLLKTGATVGCTLLSLMFYNKWMDWGLAFEETDSHTSSTFRSFTNRINPNKTI